MFTQNSTALKAESSYRLQTRCCVDCYAKRNVSSVEHTSGADDIFRDSVVIDNTCESIGGLA